MTERAASDVDGPQIDTLTGEVARLADEIRVLRDAVDELREKIWYGILNDKFPACAAPSPHDASTASCDACDSLETAVRSQIRSEMAQLTDTLNDFSLDLQFVLREARSPDQPRLCCKNPQLAWEGDLENAAVTCRSCGFVLADDGQLVDWNDPEQRADYAHFLADEQALEQPPAGGHQTADEKKQSPPRGFLFDVETR